MVNTKSLYASLGIILCTALVIGIGIFYAASDITEEENFIQTRISILSSQYKDLEVKIITLNGDIKTIETTYSNNLVSYEPTADCVSISNKSDTNIKVWHCKDKKE